MEVFYQFMSGVGMIVTFGGIVVAFVMACQFIHGKIVGMSIENYHLKQDVEYKDAEILELRAQVEQLADKGKK